MIVDGGEQFPCSLPAARDDPDRVEGLETSEHQLLPYIYSIHAFPVFLKFAVSNARNNNCCESDPFTGWSDTHELTLVSAAGSGAVDALSRSATMSSIVMRMSGKAL